MDRCPLCPEEPVVNPVPPSAESRTSLMRVMGVGFSIALAFGNTIGVGILRPVSYTHLTLPTIYSV